MKEDVIFATAAVVRRLRASIRSCNVWLASLRSQLIDCRWLERAATRSVFEVLATDFISADVADCESCTADISLLSV